MIMSMFKARDPDMMTRPELLHKLAVIEAEIQRRQGTGSSINEAPIQERRTGSVADLVLELRLLEDKARRLRGGIGS
jgi:hypothetical protein